MKRRLVLAVFLCIRLCLFAEGQTPVVEMSNAGKIVHVQELGLASTATLYDVLQLFPELIHRGSAVILPGYTLTVDGQDVGEAKYVTIMQLAVRDIDLIEIQDNVSASSARDGASGTVAVTTIPIRDGLSGSAAVTVSTETDALLSANINYQTDRLTIKGDLRADFYKTSSTSYSEKWGSGNLLYSDNMYFKQDEISEMAKLYLSYTPTMRDKLKLQLWQNYDYQTPYNEDEYHIPALTAVQFIQEETDNVRHNNSLMALLSYTHFFLGKQRLTAEVSYSYNGVRTRTQEFAYSHGTDSTYFDGKTRNMPHDLFAKVEYNGLLVSKDKHSLNMQTGISGTFQSERNESFDSGTTGATTAYDTAKVYSRHGQADLYGEFTYAYASKVALTVGARYQYDYFLQHATDTLHASVHSYMLSAILSFSPFQGHTFRANAARNFFAPSVAGRAGYNYTCGLHYIFDHSFGTGTNQHRFNAEAGFNYIQSQLTADPSELCYDTWSACLRTLYQYRLFSLSLSYYYFNNRQEVQQTLGKGTYAAFHNVSIMPVFRLPRDWHLSALVQYTSPRWGHTYHLAAYWQTELMCSKRIDKWTLTLILSDILHYKVTDKTNINTADSSYLLTSKHLNSRYLLFGVSYRF